MPDNTKLTELDKKSQTEYNDFDDSMLLSVADDDISQCFKEIRDGIFLVLQRDF